MNQLNFLQSLGWSLINSLWQMALLWVIYQFIILTFPRLRPASKTSLAILLTFSGFVWFVYTLVTSILSGNNTITSLYNTGLISDSNWNYFAARVLPYVTVAYLIILAAPVWQFIRNYRFVQMIRTTGTRKIDVAWRLYVRNTAAAMGITRNVKIWLSEWVNSPVTIGYLKPIILIPVAAMNNLTPHQLEAVILHELSHIHRYDYFLNLIISFIRTILYFNPFVKLLVKNIEKERELSCDEMVLQFQYKPGEYASALLRLEQNKYRQMVMAAAGKNHDLLNRIESILGMRKKGWNPLRQLAFATLTIMGITLLHFFIAVNEPGNKQGFYSLTSELSPYYFLNGNAVPANQLAAEGTAGTSITKKKSPIKKAEQFFFEENYAADQSLVPTFINYTTPVIPELAPEEETKVKEAVDATKKILSEHEWKAVEKAYADAFTSYEKSQLKTDYIKTETDKVDWNKLEDQLRLSYQQINWDNVNAKLSTSLAEIKLDSIQYQLNLNLKNLINLEKLMVENNVTSIPDSEICLLAVKENQQKTREQLQLIKTAKVKKIIKL
jgi:bla regulator protein BlaR1